MILGKNYGNIPKSSHALPWNPQNKRYVIIKLKPKIEVTVLKSSMDFGSLPIAEWEELPFKLYQR